MATGEDDMPLTLGYTMAGGEDVPLTRGYTINIVKERSQPAVILLNSTNSVVEGERTYFVTYPSPEEVESGDTSALLTEESVVEETVIFTQNLEVEESIYLDNGCDSNLVTSSSPLSCFTEVAHEEVVIDHKDEEKERTGNILKYKVNSETSVGNVHCDICNSTLASPALAKSHMKMVHNILTYDGPFFKCDFCGLFVTDRVAHMKMAHYSPLSQAFHKVNNMYECLRCNHTSDQLTNIRNHVDAKHRSGENSYVCEECNSEYKTLNSMRAHKSRVHRKRRLEESRRKEEKTNRLHKQISDSRNLQLEEDIRHLEHQTLIGLGNGTV